MKIVILGGGIAGVSSAIAFKQKGFDVSIYERHQAPSHIGAGIVIWPNASYVLAQLGILNEIAAVSGCPTRMRRMSHLNEDLGSIDIERINSQMGYPSFSILRSDFQDILISKLESLGVAIQYDHTVTGIETNRIQQAEIHFQDGSKVQGDIVIGADGRMSSNARQYVHGDNEPVYQKFINWIGVFESTEEFFQEIAVTDYWGIGERFGIVPVTKHKAYWAGGMACAEIAPKNPAEYKSELISIFADWPQPIQKIIQCTPIERINKIFVHDHNPIHSLHKHNLIILGDAAHASLPTSGQGACQAMEDAWHFANCLEDNTRDLQRAFLKFTELRFEKTSDITLAARRFAASLFNQDENFCKARNETSRHTDFVQVATVMSRSWGQTLPLCP